MHPTDARVPAASSAEAIVVFVFPSTPCDTQDYVVVVDEKGRWLGDVSARTRFFARVEPGEHLFFAWPHQELESLKYPDYNQVGAMAATIDAGKTYYVEVATGHYAERVLKSVCPRYPSVQLFAIAPRTETWGQLREWIDATSPLAQDPSPPPDVRDPEAMRTHLMKGGPRIPRGGARAQDRTLQRDDGQ
jgi:hypothetical protein